MGKIKAEEGCNNHTNHAQNSIIFVEEGGGARLKTYCSNTITGVCLFYQKGR